MLNIYLDYNATAPITPAVKARMLEVLSAPSNPSSVHAAGRLAKKTIEDARTVIASAISAFPKEIIFTSSGTEANNLALCAFPERRVIASAIEHSSVLKAAEGATLIPVDADGVVKLEALNEMLRANTTPAIVCLMLANNETGVIQPVREAAEMCKKHGALLHVDAVQALGKMPLDFSSLGADMMTIAGHKCGGPVGAAALVVRAGLTIPALLKGGGQELGKRAGTENVAAIAGFAAAVEGIDFAHMRRLRSWLDAIEGELEKRGAIVVGKSATRLPNTSCIATPNRSAEVQLMQLDLKGIAISTGSACSSGRIAPSHVLSAMGMEEALANCAIRISGGHSTQQADLQAFMDALPTVN